jgi:hypothetical protein
MIKTIDNDVLNYYLKNPDLMHFWLIIPTYKHRGHLEINKKTKRMYKEEGLHKEEWKKIGEKNWRTLDRGERVALWA